MIGFNVGLELRSGLLPTVWDLSLRMIQRYDVTILICHVRDGSPVLVPQRYTIWIETSRTLYPGRILYAPGAMNVHDGVSPGEPQT